MINYSIIYNKKVTFYKYKENVIRVCLFVFILFIYFFRTHLIFVE